MKEGGWFGKFLGKIFRSIMYQPSPDDQDGEQDTGEEDEDEEKKKRRKKCGSLCQCNWVHSLLQKVKVKTKIYIILGK